MLFCLYVSKNAKCKPYFLCPYDNLAQRARQVCDVLWMPLTSKFFFFILDSNI